MRGDDGSAHDLQELKTASKSTVATYRSLDHRELPGQRRSPGESGEVGELERGSARHICSRTVSFYADGEPHPYDPRSRPPHLTRRTNRSGSILGSLLGVLVFLGGVALLLVTFRLAYDMFSVPPSKALNIAAKQPVDMGVAVQSAIGLFVRVLLLAVMALVGSHIAYRGVQLHRGSIATKRREAELPD